MRLILIFVLAVVFATGLSYVVAFQQPRVRVLWIASRRPGVELLQFMNGVQWESTRSGKFPFYVRNILAFPTEWVDGLVITNGNWVELQGYYMQSVTLSSYPSELMSIWREGFRRNGWDEVYNSSDTLGEENEHEKNGRYFRFGVSTAFYPGGEHRMPAGYRVFVEHN